MEINLVKVMKKLSLVAIMEAEEDKTPARGTKNPGPRKQMQISDEDRYRAPKPTVDVPEYNNSIFEPQQDYEEEGERSKEIGLDAPWMVPGVNPGSAQQSTIPQSPAAPQEVEDFSNQIEQDSPTPQGRTGPLRPAPQMRAVTVPQRALPWSPQSATQAAYDPDRTLPQQNNPKTTARKPMRIPIK